MKKTRKHLIQILAVPLIAAMITGCRAKTENPPGQAPPPHNTPPHPPENPNKNRYPPVTPNGVYSPSPEKDDSGMMDIEELIAATPPKKRFVAPSLADVNAYIAEKGLIVNGQVFLDYFTAGNWKDSEGKPVKNWKQKLISWDERDRRKRTIDAARGLLKTGVQSGTYGKDAPL